MQIESLSRVRRFWNASKSSLLNKVPKIYHTKQEVYRINFIPVQLLHSNNSDLNHALFDRSRNTFWYLIPLFQNIRLQSKFLEWHSSCTSFSRIPIFLDLRALKIQLQTKCF